MAIDYTLVQRGTLVGSGSGVAAGPIEFPLVAPLDVDASFLAHSLDVVRGLVVVSRGTISVTSADSGNSKDLTIPAVSNLATASVRPSLRETRAGNSKGATIRLLNVTTVRVEWEGTVAVGEIIVVNFEVLDRRASLGATLELLTAAQAGSSTDVVRLNWTGTLLVGEVITAKFEVFDMAQFGQESGTGILAKSLGEILKMRRDMRRLLDRNLPSLDVVEVEGIIVTFELEKIRVSDTPLFPFKLFEDGTQIPRDITGATVRFRASQAPSGPLAWDKLCTITDGEAGRCEVRLTAADTALAGKYDADVQVTFLDGVVLTTPKFPISIQPTVA